ncbi:MAG: Burkholderia virus [Pseudomonadota bacterium]|jgi:hypothetical protein
MSNINTGGPAFPVADPFAVKCPPTDAEALRLQQGMTLRDYFAAKAMQAYITAWSINRQHPSLDEETARAAYMAADAMLEMRDA